MKKLFYFLSIVLLTMFASCSNEFDDSKLQDRLNRLEEEQKQLEEEHKQMQEQIDAQQTLLDALTKNLTIVSIVETDEGYVVTFSDNSTMIVGQGNSYIENIEVGEEAIIFTLADGTEVVLPLNSGGNSGGEVDGENNKIYYTTIDGKKLFPYDSGGAAFGAILISNTYIDGQGVLTFDDSVTTIGYQAFTECSNLTSITIPDSVTTIGGSAFYDCSSLTSVTIPDSLTSIGDSAFSLCSSLTSVTIPDGVTAIGGSAFSGCSSLTSVTIPDSVTTIGGNAFGGCSSLTSITIPDSVTAIGWHAFYGCSCLTSVTIPDGVTEIGERVFYNCSSLTSVTIPDSVTTIGYQAFYDCSSLTSVTIPDSVTSIGSNAFSGCTGELVVNCNIPSASSYSSGAFYGSKFTSVTIGDSVTSIGKYAFYGCTGELFVNCNIPSASDYENGAFYGSKFTSATIADGVTSIGDFAFDKCIRLTSITIPDSVTTIGESVFYGCSSLTSVTISDNVTTIGHAAFYDCSSLRDVNISDLSAWFRIDFSSASSNPLMNGAYLCLNNELVTELVVPSDITEIKQYALRGYTSLTSVTIGEGVTTIGESAFSICSSLTDVTIGDSVTTIGAYVFYKCSSLTSVTIPDSVTEIGESAFNNCSGLTSVYCKATTPPAGGYDMFYKNASGRKIYVPAGSVEAYKSASYWSSYANAIEMFPYIPSECTSLTITADDVIGNNTTTTIYYTAVTNGVDGWGEYTSEIITGTVISDEFPQNTSTTESIERTVSFTYLGQTATTTITQGPFVECYYTVSLNNAWRQSTSISNPDSSLYDGVYESYSNYNVSDGVATMYIDIDGYTEFSIYVRSDAESNYDYVTVSELDSTTQKMSTKGNQNSGTAISNYTKVTYTGIDGGSHRITVTYLKDNSQHSGTDRGYLIIPKNQ